MNIVAELSITHISKMLQKRLTDTKVSISEKMDDVLTITWILCPELKTNPSIQFFHDMSLEDRELYLKSFQREGFTYHISADDLTIYNRIVECCDNLPWLDDTMDNLYDARQGILTKIPKPEYSRKYKIKHYKHGTRQEPYPYKEI